MIQSLSTVAGGLICSPLDALAISHRASIFRSRPSQESEMRFLNSSSTPGTTGDGIAEHGMQQGEARAESRLDRMLFRGRALTA